MKVIIPDTIAARLIAVLRQAGPNETGGILMGEFISPETYRIKEISVSRQTGTMSRFVRGLKCVISPLSRFFERTGNNYTVYNYLGEWHSHPCHSLVPSVQDCQSMWEIVEDPAVGANFVVLLIVRLNADMQLFGTVTAFLPGKLKLDGALVLESQT